MKDFQVSAREPQSGKSATIIVKAPETIDEAINEYGGEVVLQNALANWTITLQAAIRNGLKRGETVEQIQARLADAKMGTRAQRAAVDPKKSFLAVFQAATPDEKRRLLEELMQAANI